MFSPRSEYWAVAVSLTGALLWACLAGLAGSGHAPLGVIELLFLFAPFVIMPLGLELAEIIAPPTVPVLNQVARLAQPSAAACVVISFWLSPGKIAAGLAIPWLLTCVLVAISGLAGLIDFGKSPGSLVANTARIDLAVGGGWLLLSRLGVRPLGFQEPIVLLTAVHFHYSGFATALIAAAAMRSRERRGTGSPLSQSILVTVAVLPFVLAAGFVLSPALKVVAAVAFALSIALLAAMQCSDTGAFHSGTARAIVRISSTSVLVNVARRHLCGRRLPPSGLALDAPNGQYSWRAQRVWICNGGVARLVG